jgi:hypothetical protein
MTQNNSLPAPVRGRHPSPDEYTKPSRSNRRQKRSWRRKSGAVRPELLALVVLALVSGLLLSGVLS